MVIYVVEIYEFLITYTAGVLGVVIIRVVEVLECTITYTVKFLEIASVHRVEVLIGAQAGSWPGTTFVEHGTAPRAFVH